jgi:hypothetical protein
MEDEIRQVRLEIECLRAICRRAEKRYGGDACILGDACASLLRLERAFNEIARSDRPTAHLETSRRMFAALTSDLWSLAL